ncbi:MAG: hypothetical protein Q7U37_06455 [Gallionella sp.]|nr:hypothetical protein [Gallionella sp.]MDP1594843.1 hypothetical protein [Gallionella sp.]MDP1939363.1 hypothetical protein [Gallionella sp.]
MRTTLTIDEDVLAAAKGLAMAQHKSIGNILSSLARQALRPDVSTSEMRNGVPLLMSRTGMKVVTPELVSQLRDELP